MKQISLFANAEEYADFLTLKRIFERRTEADTVRAMIQFCLKNFTQTNRNSNNSVAAAR